MNTANVTYSPIPHQMFSTVCFVSPICEWKRQKDLLNAIPKRRCLNKEVRCNIGRGGGVHHSHKVSDG